MTQEAGPTRKERLLPVLNEWTPLAAVLQDIVASYLEGATTLLVADSRNHVIRAVSLEDFSVRTFAGRPDDPGHTDGKGETARFTYPFALTFDKATNTILVGENSCIRQITPDGVVSTLCGDPDQEGYCEGVGTAAKLTAVCGAVVVGRSLFFSDTCNYCVRRIPLDGSRSSELFAGTPEEEARGLFSYPDGLVADSAGNLFLCDFTSNCIRKITPTGVVSTVAGCGECGHRDGPLDEAKFSGPSDIAFDGSGQLLVADAENQCLRSIDLEAGVVTTIAGQPGEEGHLDGLVSKATFCCPSGVAVDVATDTIFMSCEDCTIRCLSNGVVSTVCGQAGEGDHVDGAGTEARFAGSCALELI